MLVLPCHSPPCASWINILNVRLNARKSMRGWLKIPRIVFSASDISGKPQSAFQPIMSYIFENIMKTLEALQAQLKDLWNGALMGFLIKINKWTSSSTRMKNWLSTGGAFMTSWLTLEKLWLEKLWRRKAFHILIIITRSK